MNPADPLASVRTPIAQATSAWATMSLAEIRDHFESFLNAQGGPCDPSIESQFFELAGLQACQFIPQDAVAKEPILFCHGGGYQIGSITSHASLMRRIASASARPVIGFNYRLAPEHRCPAASDDCLAVFTQLIDQGVVPYALMGDSAGGALALGTAMRARDTRLPLPRKLVLISPWLDLAMSSASYETLKDQDIFSKPEQLRLMARTYVGRNGDASNPLASPIYGDLRDLPPILIHAGGADITRDDAIVLREKAAQQQSRVIVKIFPAMVHHFQMFTALPEAAQSLQEIADFVNGDT